LKPPFGRIYEARFQGPVQAFRVAGAAGVSALALTLPADAKVVYTPANVQVSGKPLPIDLNHDGITDFFLDH
jgi:hypothetical protein